MNIFMILQYHLVFCGKVFVPLCCRGELVKDVIVPLLGRLSCNPGLFQQIVLYDAAFDLVFGVKTHLHEPAEARGVVIANRFGIS